MVSLKERIFGKKSVIAVSAFSELTRDGINKAYIPKFLYKPPFGYPRFANMSYIRWLAQTPYVEMCIDTILNEIASIPWDIVPTKGMEDQADETERQHIKNFFLNPNTNDESFEEVFIKMPLRDVLEVNSGVLNKVYNLKEELVEVVARDGATFTKNPDIHGMYTNREDILLPKEIMNNPGEVVNPFQQISQYVVRESAAYFQYGWIAGPVPVPFGKKEIIWMEQMKRTDDHYGYSAVQILAKALQRLLWDIDTDLEYYNDNNVPKGILGLDDSDADEIEAFKEQWYDIQRKQDEFGNWKKLVHKVPIVNKKPEFTRIEFSSEEMQLIEKQKWYSKMVWASFGVTPTELGYTEDAKGNANQIVQSKVFRKKAINPKLRMLEYEYNKNIVEEFGYLGKIKTKTGEVELPKYEFKFQVFDTDEERNKAELYQIWIQNGIKTVNEIREQEGLKEVEWGNDPPNKIMASQGNTFNIGNGYDDQQRNAQNTDQRTKEPGQNNPTQKKPDKKSMEEPEKKDFYEFVNNGNDAEMLRSGIAAELAAINLYEDMAKKTKDLGLKKIFQDIAYEEKVHVGEFSYLLNEKKDEKQDEANEEGAKEVRDKTGMKDIEGKPGMGHSDKWWEMYHALINEGNSKESAAKITNSKIGSKAQSTENPLILKENERPTSDKRLQQAIVYMLQQNENQIMKLLEGEMQASKLQEIKDINTLIEKIKSIVSLEGLRQISNEIIRNNYLKGWDNAEKDMNRNFLPESHAIEYLQNYTFDNIKGMEADIGNKLRQTLQRAYMDGEGVEKIKARVKEVFDVGDNRAEMISRTETNRASNIGKLQAYQKSGEKGKKVYIAAMDARTSPLCRRLNGQVVGLNENFKDPQGEWEGPAPPAHVNCRSTWEFRPE